MLGLCHDAQGARARRLPSSQVMQIGEHDCILRQKSSRHKLGMRGIDLSSADADQRPHSKDVCMGLRD